MNTNRYLDIFIEDAKENVQILNTSLLELEKDPFKVSILNEIFRVAHTLKGMAGTMGFSRMTALTHHMEDVLDELRSERLKVNPSIIDILFKCLDALECYVNEVMSTGQEGEEEYQQIITSLSEVIENNLEKVKKSKDVFSRKSEKGNAAKCGTAGLRLSLNKYDKNVIEKAIETDMNVFEIYIEIDNKCLLKAARAFIIFQRLDINAEIMKSIPSVKDIEDERFDNHFIVMVITKYDHDFFIQEINSIAEVRKVEITPITSEHIRQINMNGSDEDLYNKGIDNKKLNISSPKQGMTKRLTNKTVRVDIERLNILMNLVSELIIIKTRLADVGVNERNSDYVSTIESLERITTRLHDAVMKVRMVTVENVFSRFPRMIRDISKELEKEIELHMTGEETELDRTVIDEIGEPLIHIIRNSADHGLEKPTDRVLSGKGAVGNIWLRAYQDGNNVIIEVEDDGRGIDLNKVRRKLVEKEIESEETAMALSENELITYLFNPNLSTADAVTDLSGRGVGLDAVKTKIETLGGLIELVTELGKGSKTIIRLPLTLAIIQALLVNIGTEKYAIPLNNIKEINKIDSSEIQFVRDKEVYFLRDMVIPIIRLRDILEVPDNEPIDPKKPLTCVVVNRGDKLSGFIVDSLIGQQEIVIKSLGKLLASIKCIAGATILGDGNVALIIDV